MDLQHKIFNKSRVIDLFGITETKKNFTFLFYERAGEGYNPAGEGYNPNTQNFQSKNGLLINVSLTLYVVSCKSSTSKVKHKKDSPPQYKGFQTALY